MFFLPSCISTAFVEEDETASSMAERLVTSVELAQSAVAGAETLVALVGAAASRGALEDFKHRLRSLPSAPCVNSVVIDNDEPQSVDTLLAALGALQAAKSVLFLIFIDVGATHKQLLQQLDTAARFFGDVDASSASGKIGFVVKPKSDDDDPYNSLLLALTTQTGSTVDDGALGGLLAAVLVSATQKQLGLSEDINSSTSALLLLSSVADAELANQLVNKLSGDASFRSLRTVTNPGEVFLGKCCFRGRSYSLFTPAMRSVVVSLTRNIVDKIEFEFRSSKPKFNEAATDFGHCIRLFHLLTNRLGNALPFGEAAFRAKKLVELVESEATATFEVSCASMMPLIKGAVAPDGSFQALLQRLCSFHDHFAQVALPSQELEHLKSCAPAALVERAQAAFLNEFNEQDVSSWTTYWQHIADVIDAVRHEGPLSSVVSLGSLHEALSEPLRRTITARCGSLSTEAAALASKTDFMSVGDVETIINQIANVTRLHQQMATLVGDVSDTSAMVNDRIKQTVVQLAQNAVAQIKLEDAAAGITLRKLAQFLNSRVISATLTDVASLVDQIRQDVASLSKAECENRLQLEQRLRLSSSLVGAQFEAIEGPARSYRVALAEQSNQLINDTYDRIRLHFEQIRRGIFQCFELCSEGLLSSQNGQGGDDDTKPFPIGPLIGLLELDEALVIEGSLDHEEPLATLCLEALLGDIRSTIERAEQCVFCEEVIQQHPTAASVALSRCRPLLALGETVVSMIPSSNTAAVSHSQRFARGVKAAKDKMDAAVAQAVARRIDAFSKLISDRNDALWTLVFPSDRQWLHDLRQQDSAIRTLALARSAAIADEFNHAVYQLKACSGLALASPIKFLVALLCDRVVPCAKLGLIASFNLQYVVHQVKEESSIFQFPEAMLLFYAEGCGKIADLDAQLLSECRPLFESEEEASLAFQVALLELDFAAAVDINAKIVSATAREENWKVLSATFFHFMSNTNLTRSLPTAALRNIQAVANSVELSREGDTNRALDLLLRSLEDHVASCSASFMATIGSTALASPLPHALKRLESAHRAAHAVRQAVRAEAVVSRRVDAKHPVDVALQKFTESTVLQTFRELADSLEAGERAAGVLTSLQRNEELLAPYSQLLQLRDSLISFGSERISQACQDISEVGLRLEPAALEKMCQRLQQVFADLSPSLSEESKKDIGKKLGTLQAEVADMARGQVEVAASLVTKRKWKELEEILAGPARHNQELVGRVRAELETDILAKLDSALSIDETTERLSWAVGAERIGATLIPHWAVHVDSARRKVNQEFVQLCNRLEVLLQPADVPSEVMLAEVSRLIRVLQSVALAGSEHEALIGRVMEDEMKRVTDGEKAARKQIGDLSWLGFDARITARHLLIHHCLGNGDRQNPSAQVEAAAIADAIRSTVFRDVVQLLEEGKYDELCGVLEIGNKIFTGDELSLATCLRRTFNLHLPQAFLGIDAMESYVTRLANNTAGLEQIDEVTNKLKLIGEKLVGPPSLRNIRRVCNTCLEEVASRLQRELEAILQPTASSIAKTWRLSASSLKGQQIGHVLIASLLDRISMEANGPITLRRIERELRTLPDEDLHSAAQEVLERFSKFRNDRDVIKKALGSKAAVDYIRAMKIGAGETPLDAQTCEVLLAFHNEHDDDYNTLTLSFLTNKVDIDGAAAECARRAGEPISPQQLRRIVTAVSALWCVVFRGKNVWENGRTPMLDGEDDQRLGPHVVQVVTMLYLLGAHKQGGFIDRASPSSRATGFKFPSSMVEVRTGEGKSILLGVLSIVVALLGYHVDIVCYDDYLTERDDKDLRPLREAFRNAPGVTIGISYKTFDTLMRDKIAAARNTVQALLPLDGSATPSVAVPRSAVQAEAPSWQRVILIDEADVFMQKDFFGATYDAAVSVTSDAIRRLIRHIFENRDRALTPASIAAVTAPVLREFNDISPALVKVAQRGIDQLVHNVKSFGDPKFQMDPAERRVGYVVRKQDNFNASHANKTVFAYLALEGQVPEFDKDTVEDRLALDILMGRYSYAALPSPSSYATMLGVTGTLVQMTKEEREILQRSYGVEDFAYCPPIYTNNLIEGTVQVRATEDEWIDAIADYAASCVADTRKDHKHAVLIYFKNKSSLERFAATQRKVVLSDFQRLCEGGSKDFEAIISNAVTSGTVTLCVRSFGRGVDFRKTGNHQVVVIQTFLSASLSEEAQIRGRTARRGQEGTYGLIVCKSHLQRTFRITNDELALAGSNARQLIALFRTKQSAKTAIKAAARDNRRALAERRDAVSWRHIHHMRTARDHAAQIEALCNLSSGVVPTLYVLMLDNSASMESPLNPNDLRHNETRWNALLNANAQFNRHIASLPEEERRCVSAKRIVFDIAVRERLEQYPSNFGTMFSAAFGACARVLQERKDDDDRNDATTDVVVLFLTDGEPNSKDLYQDAVQQCLRLSTQIRRFITVQIPGEDDSALRSITNTFKESGVETTYVVAETSEHVAEAFRSVTRSSHVFTK